MPPGSLIAFAITLGFLFSVASVHAQIMQAFFLKYFYWLNIKSKQELEYQNTSTELKTKYFNGKRTREK